MKQILAFYSVLFIIMKFSTRPEVVFNEWGEVVQLGMAGWTNSFVKNLNFCVTF